MITKFITNILILISIFRSTGADYGMDDITRYRLNTDVKSYPVKSPDDLFGFEVPPNVEQNMRPTKQTNDNNNNNKNQNQNQNQNNNNENEIQNHDYEEYLDQNNVLREPYPPKKVQKNRLKTYRKPMARKPMPKMIFSQYLSPQQLESEDSYQLKPTETFDDQYLSQLLQQIMATAEQMVLKQEEEVRQYEHPVIPASQLMEYLRASQFFATSDDSDPYRIERSAKF